MNNVGKIIDKFFKFPNFSSSDIVVVAVFFGHLNERKIIIAVIQKHYFLVKSKSLCCGVCVLSKVMFSVNMNIKSHLTENIIFSSSEETVR